MKGYRKIRIQPFTTEYKQNELIPYKNRWGKYVWRQPNISEDMNWPGVKAPKNCIGVECIENIWYWKYGEDI